MKKTLEKHKFVQNFGIIVITQFKNDFGHHDH